MIDKQVKKQYKTLKSSYTVTYRKVVLALLGIQAIRHNPAAVTGISALLATTITYLDIHLLDIETARSPQEILAKHAGIQPMLCNGLHNGHRRS